MSQQELDLEIARYLKGIVDALRQEAAYATKEDCVIYIEECIRDLGNYTPPETYLQAWYHRDHRFVELCEAERDCILSGNALTPIEQVQCLRTIDNIVTRIGVLEPEPQAAHVKGPLDFSGSPKPVRKPRVDRKAHD